MRRDELHLVRRSRQILRPLQIGDQLILVLGGEVRQGNRRFAAGDGYYTPAFTPYANTAGPDGARLVEIRKDPIEMLETWWDEGRPERWLRSVWAGS